VADVAIDCVPSSDFATAVDVVLGCLRREPGPVAAMESAEELSAVLVGLVDLAVSLAAQATGTADVAAIEQLLVDLRDTGVEVDLASPGGV